MQKLLATAIVTAFALIQAPAFAQDKSMEKKAEPAKAAPEAKKAEPVKAEAKGEPASAPGPKKEEEAEKGRLLVSSVSGVSGLPVRRFFAPGYSGRVLHRLSGRFESGLPREAPLSLVKKARRLLDIPFR
jgi:hypothetical protein